MSTTATHREAAAASVAALVTEELLHVERDALAIHTVMHLAQRMDAPGLEVQDAAKLATEARQWWALMKGKTAERTGRSITDGFTAEVR